MSGDRCPGVWTHPDENNIANSGRRIQKKRWAFFFVAPECPLWVTQLTTAIVLQADQPQSATSSIEPPA